MSPTPAEWTASPTGALLAMLPEGADAVAEIDLGRLRANPVVGPLVAAFSARATDEARARLGFDLLADADALAIGFYRLGREDVGALVVARGAAVRGAELEATREDATALDARTVAIGPLAWREAARQAARGSRRGMDDDAVFVRLRQAAMPPRAPGASFRLTARLSAVARVWIAGRLALDRAPATVSVWLDVVDDFAVVALLGVEDEPSGAELAGEMTAARDRYARVAPVLRRVEIERRGTVARVVWVVGPKTLAAWAQRVKARVEAPSP